MNGAMMKPRIPVELQRLAGAQRRSGAAKYEVLWQAMVSAVENGHWRPGERLPTEIALAQSLPFSLGTVQRAMRKLVEDGIVVRRQRSGTFVAVQSSAMEDPWHCRFCGDDGGYLPIFPRIIHRECVRETGPWTRHLGTAARGCVRIDRIIDINGEFSVYSRFFADAQRFEALLKRPIKSIESANFKLLLQRECRATITRFANTVQTLLFPRAVSAVLELPPHTTGLLLECAATSRGLPVYFQQLFVPPNARKLAVSDLPGRRIPETD
jgi:GntR family transcriptional regulator